jgi:hypothetical protein
MRLQLSTFFAKKRTDDVAISGSLTLEGFGGEVWLLLTHVPLGDDQVDAISMSRSAPLLPES